MLQGAANSGQSHIEFGAAGTFLRRPAHRSRIEAPLSPHSPGPLICRSGSDANLVAMTTGLARTGYRGFIGEKAFR